MTDQQKVIISLTLASETCNVVLAALRDGGLDVQESQQDLQVLQRDLISLLSLLHGSVTKLALTLKPSSPTYSASLAPIRDISIHTSSLGHCASLFNPSVHGAALTREVMIAVEDVIESLRSLIQTLLRHENGETKIGAPSGTTGEEYLVRVGAVHDVIDKARGPNGISRDNITAVRKKWMADGALLDDCLRELGEMIEDEESHGRPTNDDSCAGGDDGGVDNGWDELGLLPGDKMEKDELERAKTAHTLLRLTVLLHKRIRLDLLTPMPSPSSIKTPPNPNAPLDGFLAHSANLLIASDDLVSCLHPPQDPNAINTELSAFVSAVKSLQSGVQVFFAATAILTERLGNLNLSDDSSSLDKGGEKKDVKTWFKTCFTQIYKTSQSFTLPPLEDSTQPADNIL